MAPNTIIPGSQTPTSSDILQNMSQGSDPMSFVLNNIRGRSESDPSISYESVPASQIVNRAPTSNSIQPQVPTPANPPVLVERTKEEVDEGKDLLSQMFDKPEAKKTPEISVAPIVEDLEKEFTPPTQDAVEEEFLTGPEKSIKDFKKILTTTKQTLKDRDEALRVSNERLARIEAGEEVPESLKARLERAQTLEKYEKLHALKLSPEYEESRIRPLAEANQEAILLAQEYNIDPAIVEKAKSLKGDKRALNDLLERNLGITGASEMKTLLNKAQKIEAEIQKDQENPGNVLSDLIQDRKRTTEAQDRARRESIIQNTRGGWADAIAENQSKQIPELMLREGQEEHNAIVKPLIERAASEYGKLIKVLAEEGGVKEISPRVAKILAERFQLSEAALVAVQQRNQYWNELQEYKKGAKRENRIIRPPVGGSAVQSGATDIRSSGPLSTDTAADILLRKVGA